MRHIGIYGGSFDPIHTGHAIVAGYMSQFAGLDELWLMVSRRNPLKTDSMPAPDRHRLAMAALVAARCRGVRVSDFEMHLPAPSYTYVTLCRLREQHPDCRFSLVVGSDSWLSFHRWRNAREILEEFGIIVYPRPGYPMPEHTPPGVALAADAPRMEISSTFIRRQIAEGRDMAFFVPDDVLSYIHRHNLYIGIYGK